MPSNDLVGLPRTECTGGLRAHTAAGILTPCYPPRGNRRCCLVVDRVGPHAPRPRMLGRPIAPQPLVSCVTRDPRLPSVPPGTRALAAGVRSICGEGRRHRPGGSPPGAAGRQELGGARQREQARGAGKPGGSRVVAREGHAGPGKGKPPGQGGAPAVEDRATAWTMAVDLLATSCGPPPSPVPRPSPPGASANH